LIRAFSIVLLLLAFPFAESASCTPTITVIHKRNGVTVSTKNITLNHLGQADQTTVSGAGTPTTTLNPTFRDDGSVEAFAVTIGGAMASATFAQNGMLTGFTHPLLGTLPVSHDFDNGSENLTIDGTSLSESLDGTASWLTGAGVMARSRATEIVAGNFEHTITPATGSPTTLVSNAAGAKVLHQYAAGANPSTSWLSGGLLDSVSLGRGGALIFGYSDDGAKDLVSITWPQVSSASFPNETFYGGTIGLTERDDAGNITRLVDPSGERDMDYEKNRLTTTDWLSGELDAYKVVREPDDQGRPDKVTLYRNGTVIHGIDREFTGLSNEISGMTTEGFDAIVTRDVTSRHMTGFTRGIVTQTWGRGTAGRITSAGGNVTGAPSFAYNSFDPKGPRKSVQTNRGTWYYDYRGGNNGDGQLDTASNGTLNASFDYNFDGIGRRDFGNNQQDALNRFLAMTHPLTPKKLFITADPLAKLWIDGTAMTPFNGGWTHPLAHPGSSGGWVPWTVKGVLEDAGDEGAFDHAVAELSGNVFFPPQNESFTFDEDGNRESSALWNYGWNGRNQLVRARTKTWDSAPQGWDVSFDYDAEGRRFKKTATRYEDGDPVEQKVIYFVWDGWDLLYERHEDIQGNVLLDRRYVWGPDIADGAAGGAGGLLLIREKRGTTINDYYPLFDGTGHVTGLTDSAGNLVAEYWWGPFGELLEARGEMADANPFRYATKYYDTETGLYYFGHRYYDPVTGQFLSREPLGESESLNLYQYGHGDPINKVDVRGLKSKWVTDPNNPLTEMPDGSKVINLVWLVDKWFGDDYLDYSKRETRAFGTNYWDHHLWTKRSNGSWGASAGSQMWVDASRIAEERYHLSTYAKIGTVAMGGYSALLAAPVAGAYGTGSLFTAGGATVESSALQATNWLLLRPGAQILAADIAYTTGEIAMGIDGPGGLITPADSFRAVPKATQYADDLFSEMRHLELSWPGSMRQLSNSGVPLYMASNRAADPMAVVNALSDWNSRRHYINGQNLLLDKAGLKHILERHHPSFWDGTTRASQSFFPKNMSVYEIENAISEVLKQNPARIGEIGANGIGPMTGVVNGVRYQLGLNRGRIGQFYPILD
jgi:RHS repeat-associated protein